MKVPDKPLKSNNINLVVYQIELTEDGYEHFISEFENNNNNEGLSQENRIKNVRSHDIYDHFWYCSKEDFDKWKKRFGENKKNWQNKEEDQQNDFVWYDHICIRNKYLARKKEKKEKICNYSKSINKPCGGKMKVPLKPLPGENEKFELYRIELNKEGYGAFKLEFKNDEDDIFMNEFFEYFKVNNKEKLVSPGLSSENELTEKDDWNKLSESLKNIRISTTQQQQIPKLPIVNNLPEIISVSEDSEPINWNKVKNNSNIKMVIARSTIGLKIDKDFILNYQSMINVEFKQIGVYHHFIGGLDSPTPEEQFKLVKEILEKVKFEKKKHLFSIAVQTGISSEYNANANSTDFTIKLITFVNLLYQNDFMRPIIYCNNNSWKKLIDPNIADEKFSKLPLWIAHYTKDPNPVYPDTWKLRGIQWWMWQYKDDEVIDGIVNHVYCSKRNKQYNIKDKYFCSDV
ncbi:hypothetical protein Mgra_00003293 [Meloidogyne graminicola]|uniref:Lysozyme n=1 Tax=Meloidogyne graminicola TaxID=189291 RepID=A0A8S9ZW74_9BILA|nr:hypothetical protein Mgra_00003293 [Meloidogyne graminicola]